MKNIEIMTASHISGQDWPLTDPKQINQPVRKKHCILDLDSIKKSIIGSQINMDAFNKNTAKESLPEKILSFLACQKIQMNPTSKVKDEQLWQQNIEAAVKSGKPIELVYPMFSVIPNQVKRFDNGQITGGDDCAILFFKQINEELRQFYSPGLRFNVLADAHLYAGALDTPEHQCTEYFDTMSSRIHELGADDCINFVNFRGMIDETCPQEYQLHYDKVKEQIKNGKTVELLSDTCIDTYRRSVRSTINTQPLELSYEEQLMLFGPEQYSNPEHPKHKELEQMTDKAFDEFTAVRLACNEINLPARLWPDHIRASCHRGPSIKSGIWPVGLRPYPEYLAGSKLLSHHGMPLIVNNEEKSKLKIFPETMLRAKSQLTRVEDEQGRTYAYMQE